MYVTVHAFYREMDTRMHSRPPTAVSKPEPRPPPSVGLRVIFVFRTWDIFYGTDVVDILLD